jgi:hypothetical protein
MKRHVLAGALAALALAGCPLPQPLPDYPKGTVTPPRIVMDAIMVDGGKAAAQPIVFVPAGCGTPGTPGSKPTYTLAAGLVDANTLEQVEARWFLDYLGGHSVRGKPQQDDLVAPSQTTNDFTRSAPPYVFVPYDHPAPAELGTFTPDQNGSFSDPRIVHVVELVVSNGFDPSGTPAGAAADPPFRGPSPGFETQVYRWTFVNVDPRIVGNPSCPP